MKKRASNKKLFLFNSSQKNKLEDIISREAELTKLLQIKVRKKCFLFVRFDLIKNSDIILLRILPQGDENMER